MGSMLASIPWRERNRAGSTGRAANASDHGCENNRNPGVRSTKKHPGAAVQAVRPKEWGTTMRIERRNTTEGQSPYAGIDFRLTTSEIRNPDGSVVFRLENVEVPEFWSQVASDVLAQKYFQGRRRRQPEEGRGRDRAVLAVALGTGHRGAGHPARGRTLCQRIVVEAGVRPACRLLDLLGLEGRLLHLGTGRPRVLRRTALHAGQADGGAEFAAMVQHRAALGLRRRWTRPGPLLRRSLHRQTDQIEILLRASAAARLLHPGRQ